MPDQRGQSGEGESYYGHASEGEAVRSPPALSLQSPSASFLVLVVPKI